MASSTTDRAGLWYCWQSRKEAFHALMESVKGEGFVGV